ncbi:hypothetical protein BWI17_08065 [Betaproteobacteria bacterium GR16-43]|nr:hypothetical protein BWI17_08065 [Betaproteobacteria bacterium GR16-43]
MSLSGVTGATIGTVSASVTISNPTAAGAFSLSAPAQLAKATTTTNEIVVKHTGGGSQSPPAVVTFTVSGGCTTSTTSPINFTLGDATDKPIVITTPATSGGACIVSAVTPSGTEAKTINITEPVGPCPVVSNVVELALGNKNTPTLVVASNAQIASVPLPSQASLNKLSGILMFGESSAAYSPNPVVMEVTISKCKGVINSDYTDNCNIRRTNGNYNEMYWWSKPGAGIVDRAGSNALGACWAPDTEGPWYINTRFTHNGCAYGASTCGFALQWGGGAY